MTNPESKVTGEHLKRRAYLYVRQSTLKQVLENTESTHRQYELRKRAIGLGWQEEQIEVIDCDQAQSAGSAAERDGFQRLVAEVGLGKAGIVMGLEVSRLARNCADWHQLMQICALTKTLILDEDGLYDPDSFNDRLLLGLKATMSEAELHILKVRLRGGLLSKAQRGELKMPLPIGFVYDPADRVVLDPDREVQQTLEHFFEIFRRSGAAWATVKAFRREGLKFPRRGQAGSGKVVWEQLRHNIARKVLHNPRYAGAYCYGRKRTWKDPQGREHSVTVSRENWSILIQDAHPGYISWQEFQENQRRLEENAGARNNHKASPVREGSALLQGLAICGQCGRRMTIRYHQRNGALSPDYLCQKESVEQGEPICQSIHGGAVDQAMGQLILENVSPMALEVSLEVDKELQRRRYESDRLRYQQVERAQYEADQARTRYMRVDPNNRLVADTLESLWNEKLRELAQAKEDYERQRQSDQRQISQEQREKIMALAEDFPRLWNDPGTSHRDRKRMARLFIEDVTLCRHNDVITMNTRFKGGATKTLSVPTPPCSWQLRKTNEEIVAEIDRLLDTLTDSQIAAELNRRGWRRTPTERPFNARAVFRLRQYYQLINRADRLRAKGMLTAREMAAILETKHNLVDYWREQGLLQGARLNDKNEYLYECPDPETVQTIKRRTRLEPKEPKNQEPLS